MMSSSCSTKQTIINLPVDWPAEDKEVKRATLLGCDGALSAVNNRDPNQNGRLTTGFEKKRPGYLKPGCTWC